MNKAVLLYIVALGIFMVPLYFFRGDIFSGLEKKKSYAKEYLKEKNGAEKKEKKEKNSVPEESVRSSLLSGWQNGEYSFDNRRNSLVRAIEKALPSVVNIGTERLNRKRFLLFGDDPLQSLFEDFLRTQENTKTFSLGSGFVIDRSGLILTNAHVVDRASRIHVTLPGGFSGKAEIVAFNSTSDIALLLLQNVPEELPCSKLDYSGKLFLGETVIAAGNPFGLDSSISAGILSGTKRSFSYGGKILFSDILQTDAIVYPGNSGGPLINMNGEVIGMNVSLYKNAPGIGFAIPVQRLLDHLAAWMIPERVKKLSFGLIPGFRRDKEGKILVYVRKIIAGTPAALAGLKEGEQILKIDGKTVSEPLQINCKLVLLREGEKIRIETAGNRIFTIAPGKFKPADTLKRTEKRLGLLLTPLTGEIAEKLNYPVKNGLIVSGFSPNISSGRIRRGDLLIMVNGKRISSAEDLVPVLDSAKFGDDISCVFLTHLPRQNSGEDKKYPAFPEYRVRMRMQ